MDNKRFALLIDADNISAKYIGAILEELSTYGITTYKRIYGEDVGRGLSERFGCEDASLPD